MGPKFRVCPIQLHPCPIHSTPKNVTINKTVLIRFRATATRSTWKLDGISPPAAIRSVAEFVSSTDHNWPRLVNLADGVICISLYHWIAPQLTARHTTTCWFAPGTGRRTRVRSVSFEFAICFAIIYENEGQFFLRAN